MNHTYTPLIIEGKIYVVVDAPAKPNLIYRVDYEHYNELLAACTKYETLPEHATYWEERIGQRLTHVVTNDDGIAIPTPTLSQLSKIPTSMKYKVHQKDGKLWLVNDTYEYPTLPSDELHWLGKHGEHGEFEMGVDFETVGNDAVSALLGQAYAIPPQQKQGDEWDEIYKGVQGKFGTPSGNYFQTYATVGEVIQYIKNNLTKK